MTNDIANDESNLDLLGVKDDDSEETSTEDKTSKTEDKPEGDDEDKSKPDVVQKIKYREKYQSERSKVAKLEAELSDLRSMVKKPTDEAEAKAQEYIRNQARAVYEELLKEKELQEKKATTEFEDKIESLLEENPDIAEQELLDAIKEYDVEPQVALRILKKTAVLKKEKPKMPQARRASPQSSEDKPKPDDSKKTMWQILQEESQRFKKS